MSTLVPGAQTGLRESLLTVADGDADLTALLRSYLAPVPEPDLVGIEPDALAGLARAHLDMGRIRRPGEHLVTTFTPTEWDSHGSLVALLVSDDQRFLVDTVTLELTRQEWSLRRLYHPQPRIRRDADGNLLGVGSGDVESWMALELYPPLGHSAEDLQPELESGLRTALATVTTTVADWQPMLARCREAVAELWADGSHRPAVSDGVDLLDWLAADHFVFLGYARYVPAGDGLVPVAGTGLGLLRGVSEIDRLNVPRPGEDDPVVLMRDLRRSPVYRRAYLTHLAVRLFGPDGALRTEHRFLGLLGASAYTEAVASIPVLAAKSQRLLADCGFEPSSYGWNATRQVIATYPREELFEARVEELAPIVAAVAALRESRQTRVFLRRSRYGGFTTALVYLPRDRYNTTTRLALQRILLDELGGLELEYNTLVSESVLVRLVFVVRMGPDAPTHPDVDRIAMLAASATRSWGDDFTELAATLPSEQRGVEFGEVYEADHPPSVAMAHLHLANELTETDDLRVTIAEPPDPEDDPADLRLTVLSLRPMTLTEVMPHLSALGAQTVDERPYEWQLRDRRVLVYSFGLRLGEGEQWDAGTRSRFTAAFVASWTGRCEADQLNQLVVPAGLDWRQVSWLRALSRYLQQATLPFSQPYLATALTTYPRIAAALVKAFETKFDPAAFDAVDADAREAALAGLQQNLSEQLEQVASLDHDRILRAFWAVIRAGVRTNAFTDSATLALKLLPAELDLLPQPRPEFEVYVYSPRVHGVHLRFGSVARGGLRWSDRREDFRTEVLGLVKAQSVKNTVIVPAGAKGGFVPQSLPTGRAEQLAEGRACYRLFIEALLSVTDNIVDGAVVPPVGVVRYDGDDPYLVVAADKGTATFSDLANEVSVSRGFWLGDAFASGGTSGYDHKAMGITARGAWESVKHHFAELGLDPDTDPFTVVGIGDMAGDVFGNGMLLSRQLKLVAAFNHLHIFIDPDPKPAASFVERDRLFRLPGSTWADYDPALISAGGGVFRRDLKSVPISRPMQVALGLSESVTKLTPNELISAVLRAPVDLLFNGGVGTFVKGSAETHTSAGDKANDGVRVNGAELRARCVGEGGNLGFTQLGRVEYAENGGRINTDFIDNSAGVDTSDHEVNIKILLASELAAGRLTEPDRDMLLASMTDEVAGLVLAHNRDQNLALANAMFRRFDLAGQHEAWMTTLEQYGLDRRLEALPSTHELNARLAAGGALTSPEFSVLLSYTKIALYRWVLASDLPEDPYLADRLVQYFPQALRERYEAVMPQHRLAREIIATVAVNRFVDSQGITAYHRLSTETGAGVADIMRAQLASRSIFNAGLDEVRIRRLVGLSADVGTELRVVLLRMVERATRWLLNHRHGSLDITATVAEYGAEIAQLRPELLGLLSGRTAASSQAAEQRWLEAGLPEELARNLATAGHAHTLLNVVDVAHRLDCDLLRAAQVHYRVAEALGIELLSSGVDVLPRQVRWDAMARAALRDELLTAHTDLTAAVLTHADAEADAATAVQTWLDAHPGVAPRVAMIRQVSDGTPDVARMNVGLSQLRAMLGG